MQSNSASSLNVGGSLCVPPRVLHRLGGAARFQQLTSGHVHFFLSVLANNGGEFSHSKQACTTGLYLETQYSRPPSAALQACALGSWVHLTARGLVRISRRWLQMSCEQEQLRVLLLRGEAVRAPPAEKPTFQRPIGSPGFTLSHPGPHDAVAFTQRVLLA